MAEKLFAGSVALGVLAGGCVALGLGGVAAVVALAALLNAAAALIVALRRKYS